MNRKYIYLASTLVTLLILGSVFYFYLKSAAERKNETDYVLAKELIKNKLYNQASKIIQAHQEQFSDKPGEDKWLLLFIDSLSQDPDKQGSLLHVYTQYPDIFKKSNENAALIVASYLIASKDFDSFNKLAEEWAPNTERPEIWFVLKGDAKLADKKKTEAINWWQSQTFEGSKDSPRLVRLALMKERENDSKGAFEIITEAINKDPKNSDLYTFRAQLLERGGRLSLSLNDYKQGVESNPESQEAWNQLADFYMRQGQTALAFITLNKALSIPHIDETAIKILFWSKIIRPFPELKIDESKIENSPYKAFIKYLQGLKEDQFWSDKDFDGLVLKNFYLTHLQETYWLRLLQYLKKGQHKKAHELMAFNSFRNVSWRPDIELALLTAMHYENYDEYPINDSLRSDLLHNTTGAHYNFSPPHQLFKLLGSLFQDSKTKLSEADALLLKSDYIYPLIFLTAGWHEAGLELKDPGVIPANLPSWVPFTYTQSIKVLKGNQAALDFALKQTRTPELTLLIGEMQISLGQDNEGVQELESLSKEETPVGFKAAWSLAVLAIEKNELEKAQSLINENAQLKNHPVGKELLAQIYLKQGKKDEARSIYREIEDKSYEAKSYQASAYLEEGNLEKAKTLYEALLREFPGNPDFQANYQLILKELQKEK